MGDEEMHQETGSMTRSLRSRRGFAALRATSRAFTLIELLVVIAIIAILAAILFPVFARARDQARKTACTSNLKQISMGMMMYVNDYDEKFPAISPFTGTGGCAHDPGGGRGSTICNNDTFVQFFGWALLVQPYVKNMQVFQCPSFPKGSFKWDGWNYKKCFAKWPPLEEFPFGITYEYKLCLAAYGRAGGGMAGLQRPVDTMWVYEISAPHGFNMSSCGGAQGIQCFNNGNKALIPQRAQMGFNVCFADGHVKFMQVSQTRFVKYNARANNETYDPHWVQRFTKPGVTVDECDPSLGEDFD
jgi:prepilin-type N-terminal cleavage/methylation domain-containing protein/prepilin-type processing-associated H-X9-DG protein